MNKSTGIKIKKEEIIELHLVSDGEDNSVSCVLCKRCVNVLVAGDPDDDGYGVCILCVQAVMKNLPKIIVEKLKV